MQSGHNCNHLATESGYISYYWIISNWSFPICVYHDNILGKLITLPMVNIHRHIGPTLDRMQTAGSLFSYHSLPQTGRRFSFPNVASPFEWLFCNRPLKTKKHNMQILVKSHIGLIAFAKPVITYSWIQWLNLSIGELIGRGDWEEEREDGRTGTDRWRKYLTVYFYNTSLNILYTFSLQRFDGFMVYVLS